MNIQKGIYKKEEKQQKEGNRSMLFGFILFKLYGIFKQRLMRKVIRYLVLKLESGEDNSLTIRRIFSKYHWLDVGLYTSGGSFVMYNFTYTPPGTKIGRYCSISETMKAFNANHPMNLKSTNALFYNPLLQYAKKDLLDRTRLVIGNDVWIGHNAVILSTVSSIGDGAVIGANSVVHHDVPPYAIVTGFPARVVRYRFAEETIKELQKSRWWEKSLNELLSEFESFQKPLEGEDRIR